MRFRTIKKSSDTGRLDRAEVRAAIVALRERRYTPMAGYGVMQAAETPLVPYGGHRAR